MRLVALHLMRTGVAFDVAVAAAVAEGGSNFGSGSGSAVRGNAVRGNVVWQWL